jgi:hypothetical protein
MKEYDAFSEILILIEPYLPVHPACPGVNDAYEGFSIGIFIRRAGAFEYFPIMHQESFCKK